MGWLSVASGLLKVVGFIMGYLQRRKIVKDTEVRIALESLEAAQAALGRARAGADAVDHSPAGVRNDVDNRDADNS